MWLAVGTLTRELRDGEIVVGSGADADWRVPTADLMPRHFTVLVHGLNASLRPTTKDNVVAVNGRQLFSAPHLLNDGDVVSAGSGQFVFSDDAPRIVSAGQAATGAGYLIDEAGKIAHRLVSRSTTIGRDASNSIVIRDAAASRFHAEVRREAGGYALHSMGSGGTLMNGRKLEQPALLQQGDIIEIAYAKLQFSQLMPVGMTAAPAHEMTSDPRQRSPTLTTGKISIVPRSGGGARLWIALAALLIVGTVLAFVVAR